MTDAFIYDHVRTPRGRGKPDGSLHTITAVDLAAQTLGAIKSRNGFGAEDVDDIVWGTVMPLGEQGQVLPRMASMMAGYGAYTGAVQVNRFCASGLEACNLAAAQVMSGQAQMTIGGGVEMMSRVKDVGPDGELPEIGDDRDRIDVEKPPLLARVAAVAEDEVAALLERASQIADEEVRGHALIETVVGDQNLHTDSPVREVVTTPATPPR